MTITASSPGLASARFTETATPAAPKWLVISSGNNQSAAVNTNLPASLVAKVSDQYGNGIAGIAVSFSDGGAGGTLSATSVITNGLGRASVNYTTPATAGTITVTASSPGLVSQKFSETVTAGPAAAMSVVSENKACTLFNLVGLNCLAAVELPKNTSYTSLVP